MRNCHGRSTKTSFIFKEIVTSCGIEYQLVNNKNNQKKISTSLPNYFFYERSGKEFMFLLLQTNVTSYIRLQKQKQVAESVHSKVYLFLIKGKKVQLQLE